MATAIKAIPTLKGNADLDDFFLNDATRYAHFLMGKTYCFRLNSDLSKIVCALTISNDSIRIPLISCPPEFYVGARVR